MEPVSAIATALALGATAALKDTAAAAVKDAYAGLKALIVRKYAAVDLAPIEQNPESKGQQLVLEENLTKGGAGEDEELIDRVRQLMEAIEKQAPEAAAAVGVDLEAVKGATLRIADVSASGTGVRARHTEIGGDIEISGVRAGDTGRPPPKKP